MATAFTTIFGNEIIVSAQPRRAQKQRTGFPGAHGLVGMHMGTRGRPLVVTGRLRATGTDYSNARSKLQTTIETSIEAIEAYLWADAADYTFKDDTYKNVEFDSFRLVPDSRGKIFHFNSVGEVFVDFVCLLTILI